jgi:acyl-CoA synthetase (NDP forming)
MDIDIVSTMEPFFHPRATAVVGVSRDAWKFGSATFLALRQFGRTMPVYPVSARITEFQGTPVYPSISSLPDDADLVILCLPAKLVPEAVKECGHKGIKAVVVPSGGFREVGTDDGKRLEAELRALVGSSVRVIGPNCFGIYSPAGQLTILPGAEYPQNPGNVGFFAQSGGMTEDFCGLAPDYGFTISQAISYGNACDINEVELSEYFLADHRTEIVSAYLEGVKSGRAFFDVIGRLAAHKPTIILKGGLTPSGARAAASHTGSLAGSDTAWNAFFKQTGAIQVLTMEEMLDTISAFRLLPRTSDDRVAVVCGGGGVGVAAGDACYRAGLTLAPLSDRTVEKLASILPPTGASPHNPVDCDNPFPRPAILKDILETLATSHDGGSIIIDKIAMSVEMRHLLGYDRQVGWVDESWLEELPVSICKRYGIPVIVVQREGGESLEMMQCEAERRRLRRYYQANGIAVYPTVQRALNALGKMVAFERHKEQRQ